VRFAGGVIGAMLTLAGAMALDGSVSLHGEVRNTLSSEERQGAGDAIATDASAIPNFYVSVPNHWTNLSPTLEVIVSICHAYGVT
jgi:hypothetical protein